MRPFPVAHNISHPGVPYNTTCRDTRMDGSRETMWLGLADVAEKPDASILLVDESSYPDALALFKTMAVLSWQGLPQYLSMGPLTGRRVVLWPSYPSVWSQAQLKQIAEAAYGHATSLEWVQAHADADPRRTPAAFAGKPHEAAAWAKSRLIPYTPTPRAEPPSDKEREDEYYVDNPRPLDLFRKPVLPALKPEHLPASLGRFVFDQSEIVGSDPGILAISALVACAGVAHDGIKLQPRMNDRNWRESPRLWGAVVGDPSVRKTPAILRAINHIKVMDMNEGERSAAAIAQYRLEAKIHAKKEAAYTKAAAKDSSGTAPTPPEKPPMRRILVEDSTIEALGVVLCDNPRGVLVLRDELAGWFGAMDAYRSGGGSGKDRADWLEIYNGGPKRVDRITREPLFVRNWSACVLGGIQPSAIQRIANDLTEDGLLQRFMVVVATSPEGGGVDRESDLDALNGYRDMLDQLYRIAPPAEPIRLTPEGSATRQQFADDMRALTETDYLPIRMRHALGKWEGLFCRLAITYHVVESAYARAYPAPEIPTETVQRVDRFMRDYLFGHAMAFYADILSTNAAMEHVRWIAGWIASRRLTATSLRDIHGAYNRWRTLKDHEQMAVMRLLEDGAWLFPDTSNPGKRVVNWTVNFRVHEEFGDYGASEEARRAKVREQLAKVWTGRAENP